MASAGDSCAPHRQNGAHLPRSAARPPAAAHDHAARRRLASIPTAISGIPTAITSLNYLKQIVVTKGLSYRFAKLVEEIRPGFR
ncbi:MAG TPA: hypothetical protein VGF28_09150 [Thermoanaerobaculia bacterium]